MFDFKYKNNLNINCNNRELYAQLINYIDKIYDNDLIVLLPSINEANKLYNSLSLINKNVSIFLCDEYITSKALTVSPEFTYTRINFLNNLENLNKKILITDINGFMKKLPSVKDFKNKTISLKTNDQIKRKDLIENLVNIGYEKTSLVTEVGEFSVRGFVIDLFPINSEVPIRIELFDDEIEEIKEFKVETQTSYKQISNTTIKPIKDDYLQNNSKIINYLNNPLLIIQDEKRIETIEKNINIQKDYYEDKDYYDFKSVKTNNKININILDTEISSDLDLHASSIVEQIDNIENFKTFVISHPNKVLFFSINEKIIKEIKNLNLPIKKYIKDNLGSSFIFKDFYYISDNDVFENHLKTSFKSIYKGDKKVNNLKNIVIGDYIVHKKYGIGIYGGIETIEKNGTKKDYLLIKYKGTDKLYLPVSSMTSLYKYSSKEGKSPKINKLNSLEWEKTKYKIRKKMKDISKQLIEVSKERNKIKIEPMKNKFPEEDLFDSEFEYDETIDQLKAIEEVRRDLESTKPMDRLLCGDVGYGKTEIIFRAILKAVLNGYQVVYLCPTTLLSNQQYLSSKKRFKNFGLNIELLNRYTTTNKEKEILENLKTGKTDLIFGTHKLFNKKIEYKNLGLLIIDEEHKFGVEHKEKIKALKNNVHVLSVSATPIPRSLQMSLVGVRDLSIIETAPKNRYPVQTYVISYNELLIKEVLEKELSRDGQAFVLYNNIKNMEKVLKKLKLLLPNATIEYAHGQMNKEQSEEIMNNFVNKQIDILLTTTIIENGIDIPNANTIIVLDAENFGLSQLYQIRGRVGRSDKIAYAYFMYNNSKILTDTARKRLEAIKEFTELGSGYKLSMRDLSIRGAGDILGREQAGFIDSVGVDLYLELINEELNGEEESEEEQINIDDVKTHIDEKYSTEDDIIIELHNKINAIKNKKEYEELTKEIKDRFGYLDEDLKRYLKQELLESYINTTGVKIITNDKYKISLMLKEDIYKVLNIEELFVNATQISNKFKFVYRGTNIIITLQKLNLTEDYINLLNKLMYYIIKNKNKE